MSQLFKNNARSRLATTIGASDLSFEVTSGEGDNFPATAAGQFFLVTIENSNGDKEIVKASRAGDVFTVDALGRGLDGSTARGFAIGDLVELRLTAGFIQSLARGSLVFVIDGGGVAIAPAEIKGFIEAPFSGTISSAKAFADVQGDISIQIYKSTYANYPFTEITDAAEEISDSAGGNNLKIVGDFKTTNALTGWTTSFSRGDIFIFRVDTCTDITKVTISLSVDRMIEI